jgi:fermentation-respiration switch protein FrsA (DUF1100 family)
MKRLDEREAHGQKVSQDLPSSPATPLEPAEQATKPKARSVWFVLRRGLLNVIRLAIFVGVGFLIIVYCFQSYLIFPGASTQGQPEAQFRAGRDGELLELKTKTGERVAALYGSALTAGGRPDPDAAARPTVLFFYGNAMCLNYATPIYHRFRSLGLNVIVPDYLGYGMSGGRPSEQGCQETADAVYDYAVSTRGVEPRRIVAAGWSLGGAVAIDLAARQQVGGLIAFSTFTSTNDMARTFAPVPLPRWFFVHRFESLKKLPTVACPILLGHGRRDSLVPFRMFEQMSMAVKDRATTVVIDDANHNDFFDVGGGRIDEAIAAFCRKNLP